MASIEIIHDDEGRIVSKKHSDDQEGEEFDIASGSFHEIEGAVEAFKHKALTKFERTLLEHEQI